MLFEFVVLACHLIQAPPHCASIVRSRFALYYWYTQVLTGFGEKLGSDISTMKYVLLPDNVMLATKGQSATIAWSGVYWIER